MKTIKCDRCGKDIPYVPPYVNVAQQGIITPTIIMTVWEPLSQRVMNVDLCDNCQKAVYDYIFDYHLPRETNEQ